MDTTESFREALSFPREKYKSLIEIQLSNLTWPLNIAKYRNAEQVNDPLHDRILFFPKTECRWESEIYVLKHIYISKTSY